MQRHERADTQNVFENHGSVLSLRRETEGPRARPVVSRVRPSCPCIWSQLHKGIGYFIVPKDFSLFSGDDRLKCSGSEREREEEAAKTGGGGGGGWRISDKSLCSGVCYLRFFLFCGDLFPFLREKHKAMISFPR